VSLINLLEDRDGPLLFSQNINESAEQKHTSPQNLGVSEVPNAVDNKQQLTALEQEELIFKDREIQPLRNFDPFPDKTPSDILSRRYKIWTGSLSSSTLYNFLPVNLLANVPVIAKYLSLFRFLKAGIKLNFQVVTNPMQYGLIGISYLPYTNADGTLTSFAQNSQANMHFLDISEQTTFELALPYHRPELFYDIVLGDFRSWRIDVTCFDVSTVTTASSTLCVMDVYASFTDVHAAGYLPNVAMFQACNGDESLSLRSFSSDYLPDVAVFQMRHSDRPWPHRIAGIANTAQNVLGTTIGTLAGTAVYKGIESTVSPDAAGEDEIHLCEDDAVEDNDSSNVKLDLAGDISKPRMNNTRGTSCRLGDAQLTAHTLYPTIDNIYRVKEICSIPVYQQSFTLATPEDISTLNLSPIVPFSHAAYVARLFKYFRGGTSVLLKFCCSPLVSARVLITS